MTCGNGWDSLFLLEELRVEELLAVDLQPMAVENTRSLLKEQDLTGNWKVLRADHSRPSEWMEERADLFIYNLGYLPKGDKSIRTTAKSTIQSVQAVIADWLNPGGIILLTFYPGHPGGEEERDGILDYAKGLDQREYLVWHSRFINQINSPPEFLLIERGWMDE